MWQQHTLIHTSEFLLAHTNSPLIGLQQTKFNHTDLLFYSFACQKAGQNVFVTAKTCIQASLAFTAHSANDHVDTHKLLSMLCHGFPLVTDAPCLGYSSDASLTLAHVARVTKESQLPCQIWPVYNVTPLRTSPSCERYIKLISMNIWMKADCKCHRSLWENVNSSGESNLVNAQKC